VNTESVFDQSQPRIVGNTFRLTIASSLAGLFILTTFVPLTPFIGGPAFITLEIVMIPVIAWLLPPSLAVFTALVGSIGMFLAQTSFYNAFGLPGILIPVIATVIGSVAFNYRLGPILAWTYVIIGLVYYILFSQGGTMFWLIPYVIVIISLPLALRNKDKLFTIGLIAFYTAMSEQVTMNILSISLLHLVGPVWTIITPFMYSERTVATIGGTLLIVALKSRLGVRLGLDKMKHGGE
jgi:hypothetical protein